MNKIALASIYGEGNIKLKRMNEQPIPVEKTQRYTHNQYQVEIDFLGSIKTLFVAVDKNIPYDQIENEVKHKVSEFMERSISYTYSQKLI